MFIVNIYKLLGFPCHSLHDTLPFISLTVFHLYLLSVMIIWADSKTHVLKDKLSKRVGFMGDDYGIHAIGLPDCFLRDHKVEIVVGVLSDI